MKNPKDETTLDLDLHVAGDTDEAKARQSTKCPQCGTSVPQPVGSGRKAIYCSVRCRSQASRLNRKARGLSRPRRKPAAEPRPCSICSTEFTPWRGGQKTCGAPKCQQRHHAARQAQVRNIDRVVLEPRPCAICGTMYKPKQSTHYTCKSECGKELARQKAAAKWKASHPEHERECGVCGKEFTTTKPHQAYCSHLCYVEARTARARSKSVLLVKNCVECGEEFRPRSNAQILCSDPCREEHKRKADAARYDPKGPYVPEWMREMDESIVKGTTFTDPEQKAAEDLGHWLTLNAEWYRKHEDTIKKESVRPTPPTPRELHRAGVNLHQQIRQWLGVRKGGEDDTFARLR